VEKSTSQDSSNENAATAAYQTHILFAFGKDNVREAKGAIFFDALVISNAIAMNAL
jgi:hypothetical protein